MSRQIDLTKLGLMDQTRAMACADLLLQNQHSDECPVRSGASISCVLPFACCVFDEFEVLNSELEILKNQ